jgi:hypothetical protein
MKSFRLDEKRSLQFRSEFYNLPNHLNLGLPGRSNGAPRNIQLALKLYF